MKKSGDIRKELALHGLLFNLLKGAFWVLLSSWLSLAVPVLQIQNEDIANRVVDMAFIDVVDYEQANGELRRIYDIIAALKTHGWTDRAILDATLVVAYFNFVNRIVPGLGLDPVEGEIGGYKYD